MQLMKLSVCVDYDKGVPHQHHHAFHICEDRSNE